MDSVEQLIREFARVRDVPFVPELRLWLADELVPLWQASEWRAAGPQAPPFWAFAWPGSLALARFLFEQPHHVAHKRVLDFGSGGGLAAIAAAKLGAASVLASDIDALAIVAQRMNAELNGVDFDRTSEDLLDGPIANNSVAQASGRALHDDVVLAGDVCYEREPAERVSAWLRTLASAGVEVLLADPGRHYVPSDGLELLATYDVPTLRELESAEVKKTRLWRRS
jgi:predicted nicotinamide N-methyase